MKRVRYLLLAPILLALTGPARTQTLTTRTYVPKPGALVRIECAGIPELLAQLPDTRLGRLLADPDVAAAAAKARERWSALGQRQADVLAAGRKLNLLDLDAQSGMFMRELDVHDLQRLETLAYVWGENRIPRTFTIVQPSPRGEGRITRLFDDHVEAMRACKDARPGPDAVVDGVPVHSLARKEPEDEGMGAFLRPAPWFVHLPGTFVLGEGDVEGAGRMADVAATPAGVVLEFDLRAYLDLLRPLFEVPAEVANAVGLDQIERLRFSVRLCDDETLEDWEVVLAGAARGVLAALVSGKGKLPAQPLPQGALAQVRLAIDMGKLIDVVEAAVVSDGDSEAGRLVRDVAAAFDGGLAFAVCAPQPGVVPRLYLSLGIADGEALDRVLARLGSLGVQQKTSERDGVTFTALKIPGLPGLLQPTFARNNGLLHLAETSISLRALLAAGDGGGEAMDVGDAALPEADGEVVSGFDLRFDPAALYRTFHGHWLPLYTVAMAASGEGKALVLAAELPEPDVLAEHLRPVRGVLRGTERGLLLRQAGTLGGVLAHALAFAWPTMLSQEAGNRWQVERLQREIAKEKLLALVPVLARFEAEHGRRPASLAELAGSTRLDADALLIPGDEYVEPAGALRTSFRYFAKPVTVDNGGETHHVLFVAIAPYRYNRPVLTVDGSIPDLWGEVCTRPIDDFGK